MDKFNIANMAKGAMVELTDGEITKTLENISDTNTDWKKKRKVTCELIFQCTDEIRDTVQVNIQVKSLVAPYKPVQTQVFLGKDNNGNVHAAEFVKGTIPGQTSIEETEITESGTVFNKETGEILNEKPKQERKIVNINR